MIMFEGREREGHRGIISLDILTGNEVVSVQCFGMPGSRLQPFRECMSE